MGEHSVGRTVSISGKLESRRLKTLSWLQDVFLCILVLIPIKIRQANKFVWMSQLIYL
jgi:hypothetical protein